MLKFFWLPILLTYSLSGFAKDYIIFSVSQDFPMGNEVDSIRKNYYINVGENQGVKKGTVLNVLRRMTRLDPYNTSIRHRYDVPIGKIKVIHVEENSAITVSEAVNNKKDDPYFEVSNFMIGDNVQIDIN